MKVLFLSGISLHLERLAHRYASFLTHETCIILHLEFVSSLLIRELLATRCKLEHPKRSPITLRVYFARSFRCYSRDNIILSLPRNVISVE